MALGSRYKSTSFANRSIRSRLAASSSVRKSGIKSETPRSYSRHGGQMYRLIYFPGIALLEYIRFCYNRKLAI
jgi:hypothetical protein